MRLENLHIVNERAAAREKWMEHRRKITSMRLLVLSGAQPSEAIFSEIFRVHADELREVIIAFIDSKLKKINDELHALGVVLPDDLDVHAEITAANTQEAA